jgi:hypothetical protein
MDEKQGSVAERRAAARASWVQLIGAFEASGKTGAAYCRDRGLPVWQFRYWLKALRQAEVAPTGFVELSADVRDPGVWVACGRWRVHVGDGFDAGVLRRVAEALA